MDCEERIMLSASRSLEGIGLRLGDLHADDLAAGEVQGGVLGESVLPISQWTLSGGSSKNSSSS